MTLVPTPAQLELHSPALGPWFNDDIDPLPLPSTTDLAIDVTLSSVSWLPPASGWLSFFIATTPRPQGLAALRDATGAPAFATGSFVALFRLLPWVERRLDALVGATIGSIATPNTANVPTRPMVRALALELTTPPADMAALEALLPEGYSFPSGVNDDADKAANLGLTWDGSTLGNGPFPMTDLYQPGTLFPESGLRQELLQFSTSTPVRLWAFDHRGRPLDAGAVAAWWNLLAAVAFNNLWAAGVEQRTARVEDGLVFHLVNAHEGPLDLAPTGLNLQDATGSGVVQTAHSNRGVTVTFTGQPSGDDYPQPLVAVLPDGRYDDQAQAWPNGALNNLARDFARIGVQSVEHALVGQKRVTTATTEAARRRARDQVRDSTGIRPARSARGALLAGTDAVLAALATPAGGTQQTTLVASVVERDTGPIATLALPGIAPPTTAPTITCVALDGGGAATGGVALGQKVLATVSVGAAFQGAWVRVWPLGFDPASGEHVRLDGAAAPVDANGDARMVLPLPDGTVTETEPFPRLACDVTVVAGQKQERVFPDLRFDRPFPTGAAAPVPLAAATGPFLVCATGTQQAGALPNGTVPSGSEVVALGAATPQLVDRTTIPAAAFATGCVINLLASGDVVQITEPAFQTQAAGDARAALTETGATVREETRQPFTRGGFWQAGFPLPGMERLEVLVSHPPDTPTTFNGAAVVGSTPLRGSLHEQLFHHEGNPGAPGAPDVHGNGVLVTGSASVAFAEYGRDRVIRSTVALVQDAQDPIDDLGQPNDDSLWIAALRTEAAGVAAELEWSLLNSALGQPYPFDGTWDDVAEFLFDVLGSLPTPTAAGLVSARRALDRRMLTATYGAREGATAIVAALARAEDFVYIETPALDALTFGDAAAGDHVALWQALMDRMDAVPSLHVAVCLPLHLLPGAPSELQRVRDRVVSEALTAMVSGGTRAERFAAFSPAAGPARSLRIASTTVIVDDAVAIVGTTHLWRRGLSFDSSLAAAVLDERQQRGRSQEVTNFRAALMAGRLGILPAELPLDPVDAIRAIAQLVARGGFDRLAPARIRPPDPTLTTVDDASAGDVTDVDIWNPDGSFPDLDPFGWLLGLRTAVYDDVFNPPPA